MGYTHRQQVRKIVRRVAKHLKFNIREIACSSTVRDTHESTIIPRIIAHAMRRVWNDTLYYFSMNLGCIFLVRNLNFSSTFYSGDALFFHSNLLHCSGQNSSPNRRWAFLTAYNTVSNRKCKPHHHPDYQPLEKVRKS